jgi:hypothetical protein
MYQLPFNPRIKALGEMRYPTVTSLSLFRIAGRAFRGLFKSPTPQDILGVYAGLFPGGPGSPPSAASPN